MIIVHLTSVHKYNDIRIFYKECTSLSLVGYEVHLVATSSPECKEGNVAIHNIKKYRNRLLRMTIGIVKFYNKAISINADIYHFHDPELIIVGLILLLKGKIVIYDVHEDVPRDILSKEWIPQYIRKIIAVFYEKLEDFAAKRFSAVITATPHINNRFLQIGCKSININNYPILRELWLSDIKWNERENAVCYIGGISAIRGIDEMVSAIHDLPVKLYIAGEFDSIETQNKVEQLDEWNKVTYLGFLNRQEIVEVLNKSVAGLVILHPLVNYLDSLPIKMFEYMAAGIPVIASNFKLWAEIIDSNKCGICVDPFNTKEISKAIQYIIDNPDKAREMGMNGRKAVEILFNWENEANKLIKLYSEFDYIKDNK